MLNDNGNVKGNYEKGNGLIGMIERIEEIKGTIIHSRQNGSFYIAIKIPLSNAFSKSL